MLLIRTSSHIWGRWYLPMFLFRDGILTLMNIDSFISLERFCSFPAHYAKVIKCGSMTCDVTVVMNWQGGFQMFFKPLSKWSSYLSYVLLITFQPVTFESVDYATLFCYVVFILKCHQFIFYGLSTHEMYLYAISLTYVLEALTQAFIVRYCNITSIDGFGVFVTVFGCSGSTCLQFHPVDGTCRILASWQNPLYVCLFLFKLIFVGKNVFGPV